MRQLSRRRVRIAASALAMAAGALSLAHAQVDPFAAVPRPQPQGQQPGRGPAPAPSPTSVLAAPPAAPANQAGTRSGFLMVEQAVGASYSAAQTKNPASLISIRTLPKSVSPLAVTLKASNPKSFKAKPRVVIPTYTLALVEQGGMRASGMGQGSDIQQRATSLSTVLVGVTDEMASALAEEAQADLVNRLTAAGIEVVPQSEASANADMGRLKALGPKAKGANDWIVYGATSAPLYGGHPLTSQPLQISGANIALTDVSFGLNAVVLQPFLAIDYERLGGSGNSKYTGSASVSAEVRFRIADGGANFIYGTAKGKGSGPGGSFRADPTGTDEQFGVMFEINDKSDDPAINNAFARLGLGSLYRQSKYYGVEVSPERYQALVRAAFQGLNAAIVAEIQKGRA